MATYSSIRHGGQPNRQPLTIEAPVHQTLSFTNNYELAQSTPRSIKSFDRLCLDDIHDRIEWRAASKAPSPSEVVVPRDFDPDYDWQQNGMSSRIDLDKYRRRSEPQTCALNTRIRQETNLSSRNRHSSPLIIWESINRRSLIQYAPDPSYAFLSRQDSLRDESKSVFKMHACAIADEGRLRLEQLNRKVLLAMERQPLDRRRSSAEMSESSQRRDSEQIRSIGGHEVPVRSALATEYIPPGPGKPPYRPLAHPDSQIRLFRLARTSQDGKITGKFMYSDIDSCPKYTALSYAWGEATKRRKITVEGQDDVEIGENLWWFLHCRGLTMKKPRIFWIDAICIDQSNVKERNHQVGLMKRIYSLASNVYIWLGRDSENSCLAMAYLANNAMGPEKRQLEARRSIWDSQEGKAIRDLFERPYWRRMWIIQEIIHANRLTVWCGSQRVDWPVLDRLYLTMKTLEEDDQLSHHDFAAEVMRSPAFVMVWQRAHWKHPETPTPKLQTLIEIFQAWECTDIRDKVYALVSMADQKTAVLPDYSRSAQEIYHDVLRHGVACHSRFRKLLSRVLGISEDRQF